MQHISDAKKRKMEASENNFTALAHVRTTFQHVDSGIPTTSGPTAIVDAEMRQDPVLQGGFAGYIFMCSHKTKQDCFIYRVFGLPASGIDVVEQIKPNAKLFLFDFEAKLLYGPYVADSVGKLALEPHAFGGRFPAQVKFSIVNDCLPLSEAIFKDAIKENYHSKFKFKQDLSYEQVGKLVSLFHPITLRSQKQDSLTYPSHCSAPGIPLPSLHSSHNRIPLSRGDEMPSNLYHSRIAYGGYGSARSPQPYHPDDPSFQRHDTHLLRAPHWVAMAQIPSDQTSTFNPSLSNAPGVRHVNNLQNASNYTEPGYHYQSYSGTHETAAVPAAINAYNGNLTSSSNFYAQEGPQPRTSEVRAGNQYPYYNSTNSTSTHETAAVPAAINAYTGNLTSSSNFYAQEGPQPRTSEVRAGNQYPYYDSTNSTRLSYGHGYQPYIGLHQDVNNVAYGNQTYPISQVPVPEASADPNAASVYANYSTMAYGYQNEGYTGYYQAMPRTSAQSTGDLPVQAYPQTQSLPGLAQTVSSGSGVVDNAHSYYNQGY